jgi:dTDP-L-rhamnose 4-epimerase
MNELVMITGGAGFIGSHLADELLARGYRVRVLDNLAPQVHGPEGQVPSYVSPEVEFFHGDVRDPNRVEQALHGVDAVFHFAAAVGVGQSMYEINQYTSINTLGTAVLLESVIRRPVRKLIVASSMSIYGEGLYRSANGVVMPAGRTLGQLEAGEWEPTDETGLPLTPIPTSETKTPSLASIYALTKYDQEQMCLMIGRAYKIPTLALRFFNVFGTRQALSNPYTGVLAIFCARYMNNRSPLIFEDGFQRRDFVSVYDVAQACRLALESAEVADRVFNVGSGRAYTVREVAEEMSRVLGKTGLSPTITRKYRVGDIRHCFADISRARSDLGYEPRVPLEEGLTELSAWIETQEADDRVDAAAEELILRGLTL